MSMHMLAAAQEVTLSNADEREQTELATVVVDVQQSVMGTVSPSSVSVHTVVDGLNEESVTMIAADHDIQSTTASIKDIHVHQRSSSLSSNASAVAAANSISSASPSPRTEEASKPTWEWSGKSNIMVCVRVRPMNRTERRSSNEVVRIMDDRMVVVMDPKTQNQARSSLDPLRAARTREKRYAFDHVFNSSAPQMLIFNHTTRLLIPGVIQGYNATVFAYGATGAGKTYTMLGSPSNPGCMFNTLSFLFSEIASATRRERVKYTVRISMIEIYNELIKDLLEPSSDNPNLDLREDPVKGPTVAGMAEIVAKSADEVMGLLHNGNKRRTQEATQANATSSRSHAVLQVVVEQRDVNPGPQSAVKIGKLSMIDLAGSERASATNNRGQRLIEGANINRSLLALGNCINALVMSKKNGYIPYRDSKLTRLLKDSLGGNCRTIMIANITPAASSFEETLNTLKYANRAKKIKTQATRNVLNVSYHVTQYLALISGLKQEIQGLKEDLSTARAATSSKPNRLSDTVNKRESEELKTVRSEIVQGFHESMRLQKALVDLDSQAVQQRIDMRKLQLIIVRGTDQKAIQMVPRKNTQDVTYKFSSLSLDRNVDEMSGSTNYSQDEFELENTLRNHGSRSDTIEQEKRISPLSADILTTHTEHQSKNQNIYIAGERPPVSHKEVETARKELVRLKHILKTNQERRREVETKMQQIQMNNRALKQDVMNRLTSHDRAELLELEIRLGMLEVQNMELEHSRMMHQNIIEEKNTLIERLRLQLEARDNVIEQQRAALEALGANERCQTAYQTLERLPTAVKKVRNVSKSHQKHKQQNRQQQFMHMQLHHNSNDRQVQQSLLLPLPLPLPLYRPTKEPHPLERPTHRHHPNSISSLPNRHLNTTGGPPSRQRAAAARAEGSGGLTGFVQSDEFPGLHLQTDPGAVDDLDQTVRQDYDVLSHENVYSTSKAMHSSPAAVSSKRVQKKNVVQLSPLHVNLPSRLRSPLLSPHGRNGVRKSKGRIENHSRIKYSDQRNKKSAKAASLSKRKSWGSNMHNTKSLQNHHPSKFGYNSFEYERQIKDMDADRERSNWNSKGSMSSKKKIHLPNRPNSLNAAEFGYKHAPITTTFRSKNDMQLLSRRQLQKKKEEARKATDRFQHQQRLRQNQAISSNHKKTNRQLRKLPVLDTVNITSYKSPAALEYRTRRDKNIKKRNKKKSWNSGYHRRHQGVKKAYRRGQRYHNSGNQR